MSFGIALLKILNVLISKYNFRILLLLFVIVFIMIFFKGSCSGRNNHNENHTPNLNQILESTVSELANVEIAERSTTEFLEQTESRKLPLIPISTATYTVRFKVRYSYVVSAVPSRWSIREDKGIIYVTAPEIVPKEPCVDSNSIGAYTGGFLIFKKAKKLETLRLNVSEVARERAKGKGIDLVREQCRRSIGKIIMKWVKQYGSESRAVMVRFNDESDY